MNSYTPEMHGSVTVWSKWQIVIPKEVRNILKIQEWDKLMVITKWDIALGLIKADNMQCMLEYLHKEMNKGA